MTHSKQDLATEAMRLLGLLEAQEVASTEDAAHIVRAYDNKFAEWQLRELAYWDAASIPPEVFQHVARMIADEVATAFGTAAPMEIDENGDQVSMGVKGLRGLRRIIARDRSGLAAVGVYF